MRPLNVLIDQYPVIKVQKSGEIVISLGPGNRTSLRKRSAPNSLNGLRTSHLHDDHLECSRAPSNCLSRAFLVRTPGLIFP